jgi:hypothetical protein
MELIDASDILILRDAKMDDWKEWIITIILLPFFILGFAVLYIIMVATVLMAMFIEWYNNVPLPRSKK